MTMDPLSITTGVLALAGVAYRVSLQLKSFKDGCDTVDDNVNSMINEVESLVRILESMKETFEHAGSQTASQTTGHVGTHWRNLNRSLLDAQKTMEQLAGLLEGVNKDARFLDGPRKLVRLRGATDQIVVFRRQIQSYKDALQLSLQTMIL